MANVDVIHEVMRRKRRVSFTYWKVGLDGEQHAQRGGEEYLGTPMRVTFSENRYYLTAWSDKLEEVHEYRVDRMRDMRVRPEKAFRCQAISEHEYLAHDYQYFGRFDGPLVSITLRVTEALMSAVSDCFGSNMETSTREDGAADVHVAVRVSPQLFGWVAGMNGGVRIVAPSNVRDEYLDYLKGLLYGGGHAVSS